ncbi:amidohydrolase family protein [Nitrospirillum viridazoti]|uniref:Amidohydrolase n=1 Tax=Nitrospirillum viridazoti CBAmc TaxID=1441467 RepID=A0A248JZP6_9PROT|nr:amidohydrolase family protein [Nitrospirillum amazonense]ASG23976.1 amidohydrolase [Nitrospirillum amazonense CBAmc]TWB44586.1 amidohydrolase family protein [Nitrospirillum amazonense]
MSKLALAFAVTLIAFAANADELLYTEADFASVPKFDAHVHANRQRPQFLDIARKDGFELLSINVDYPDFPPLADQAKVAHALKALDPGRFHFATTFSMKGYDGKGWAAATIRHLDAEFAQGALAVKVWKNIGMVERNAQGRLIMLDDPGFDPVMNHLAQKHIPLIAHQGEPKNCWLPLDQMTTENDRSYFREHPEYHMYLHPEQPSLETILAARDRMIERHPDLAVDGAHMGSLEWDVDLLAKFLDAHPNAVVDLAARLTNVQYQSVRDHDKVRAFFIRYQDRLLYGTDLTDNPPSPQERAQNPPREEGGITAEADHFWRSDWLYLATTGSQRIDALNAEVKGLGLPKAVIDKIYWSNARREVHLRP